MRVRLADARKLGHRGGMEQIRTYDLGVIGGGVNGCGIARDAAGAAGGIWS